KAGANISIAEDGTISSTGGSGTGGVNQSYVDQKFQEAVNQAENYTNERIPNFTFEKNRGGIENDRYRKNKTKRCTGLSTKLIGML
ncbi:hypothetical protein EFP6CTSP_16435, partial [Enterococcus faecium]